VGIKVMGRLLRELALRVLGERGRWVWSRLEVIGDIAVIKKPIYGDLTLEDFVVLAEELLKVVPVKSVWLAVTPVSGPYKTRGFVHLAGEPRSWTIYREHGCSFKVDITKVFVTPRLGHEHLRVAKLVRGGEVVVNMFAGVGVFSIVIARLSKPGRVHSIDINPEAYNMMVENIRLNKVEGIVVPYLGDAARVVEERLAGVADRVLMPLPDLALEYSPQALLALRGPRGFIHFYLHLKADKERMFYSKAVEMVRGKVEAESWILANARTRVVRKVGPGMVQVVVDAEVERFKGVA
jgi:tRNA (guanine37-N1)-methyltransferase